MLRRQFIFICLHHHHTFAVRWQYVRVRRVKGVVHAHYQISDWCDNATTKCIKSTTSHLPRTRTKNFACESGTPLPTNLQSFTSITQVLPEITSRTSLLGQFSSLFDQMRGHLANTARTWLVSSLATPHGPREDSTHVGTSRVHLRHRVLTDRPTGRT